MKNVIADLRYAFRRLVRSPAFLVAAVITLALGVGLNTAIFALIDQVLLQPLPYPDSKRLVAITETRDGEERSTAWLDYLDWRENNRSFRDIAAFWRRNLVITSDGGAEQVRGLAVTSNLFRTLGVTPLLGRTFPDSHEEPGPPPEVILTHGLWQNRFGSDPNILERNVILDGQPHAVIGVTPRGFEFPNGIFLGRSDLYLPAGVSTGDESWQDRDDHPGIYAIGRLAEGMTIDDARTDLEAIAETLRETYPESNEHTGVQTEPVLEELVGDLPATLKMLFLGVAAVLLIAIANVSGLAAARSIAREHEIAVRSALGAKKFRIIRMLLAEYALMGILSFCAAIVVAWASIRISAPLLEGLPRLEQVSPDPRIMIFGLGIAMGAAVLAGLLPSIRISGRAGTPALRSRHAEGSDRSGARAVLVILQIGLALVLLTGSLLLTKTLLELRTNDGGIRPDGVMTFRIAFPESEYDDDRLRSFHDVFFERLDGVAQIEAAGAISTLPFSGSGRQSGFHRHGEPDSTAVPTDLAVVTPGYFEAMGIDLLQGRTFVDRDDASSPIVAVADERFAERFWPGENALGRKVDGWGFHGITVVGVVRHVKNYGVGADSRAELYLAYPQRPMSIMHGVVKTGGSPDVVAPVVRRIVADLDPGLPIGATRSMLEVVAGTRTTSELAALIAIALSAIATLLAAIGLYSLLANEVLRRQHEIGIRMALGAGRGSILALVGRRSLQLALVGTSIGLLATWWLVRFLEVFLYEVEPYDPSIFAAAFGTMVLIVLAASLLPMLRASRSDPAAVLREAS